MNETEVKKRTLPPSTLLAPLPAAMVSCGTGEEKNIITIAWTGIVNSEPPMTYISVRQSRHSHEIIRKTGEFVINLTTEALTYAADWCGVMSGREVDKWAEMGLTPMAASRVSCPLIAESPVNLECQVREIHHYPSHDMFVAEIVAVHADESLFDEKDRMLLEKAGLLAFIHSHYLPVPPPKRNALPLRMGFSVMKPKTKKRLSRQAHQERIEENRARRAGQKTAVRKSAGPKPAVKPEAKAAAKPASPKPARKPAAKPEAKAAAKLASQKPARKPAAKSAGRKTKGKKEEKG